VNPETTEELLSRMEREHGSGATINRIGAGFGTPQCNRCGVPFPCERARVVAHIRSLEQTLGASSRICPHSFRHAECAACNYQAGWRAALGEALKE
jgi:hypothetical protein